MAQRTWVGSARGGCVGFAGTACVGVGVGTGTGLVVPQPAMDNTKASANGRTRRLSAIGRIQRWHQVCGTGVVSRYRAAALIPVLGAIAVAALIYLNGPRETAAPSPSPNPTSATAAATPSILASPSATASASLAGLRYASPGLGYSIETPPPWHRSSCSAAVVTQQGTAPASDEFVSVSARDETGTDIGSAYPILRVIVSANPQGISARQWAEQGPTVGGTAGERIEDVSYADRPAARKVLSLAGTPLDTYFVANGGRMYVVSPFSNVPPDGATQQSMTRMIQSFRFLTDAEQAAARAAVPNPLPPRTPEQVVDSVAAAFTAKDAAALAGFLSACVTTAGEQAGGSFVSREKYVDDLRAAFAGGLVVTVQPRPLGGDRASGNLTAASTWRATLVRERKLMLRRGDNDRWEWQGTIERF